MHAFPRLRFALVSGSIGVGFMAGMSPRSVISCREGEPVARVATVIPGQSVARVIDGKAIAAQIRQELKEHTNALKRDYGIVPGLAVVLVGDRPDSATYVRMKKCAADEVGFYSVDRHFTEQVSESEIINCVKELNADPKVQPSPAPHESSLRMPFIGNTTTSPSSYNCPHVALRDFQIHGILVQLPLPRHIDEAKESYAAFSSLP